MTTQVQLSYGQRRLWTLDRIENNSSTYNMPIALRLKGSIDIKALSLALVSIIERHESLRTLIVENDAGYPTGILVDSIKQPDFLVIDDLIYLHESNSKKISNTVNRLIQETANTPFKLDTEIPFRAKLFLLAHNNSILVLTMHHHAGDGASWNIISRELNLAYTAFTLGKAAHLEALSIQYSDWAHWQEISLKKKLKEKLQKAKKRLIGLPERLTLPCDHPRHIDRHHRAGYVAIELDARTVKKLDALARSANTTVFATLLAMYGATLGRIAGQSSIVIGSPTSGRTRTETEQVVGFFLNTLVVPICVDFSVTTSQLIKTTKAQLEAAIVDQDLPFELLVEEMGVARSLDHTPIFQAMISFQNQGVSNFKLANIEIENLPIGQATTKFDLTLVLEPLANGAISGVMEFDADLYDENSVKTWAGSFIQLTEAAAHAPDLCLAEIPIMDPAARRTVAAESKGSLRDLSGHATNLASLFGQQVQQSPDRCALLFEKDHQWEQISYKELDARANQLARYLISLKVAADQIVAVLLDRSPQMIIAMLAVLKTGAAYLPLDPDLPASRLNFMLGDSRAKVLLTSSEKRVLVTKTITLSGEIASHVNTSLSETAVIVLDDAMTIAFLNDLSSKALLVKEQINSVLPMHLAYLIYTSGSTGTPKGAGNTHQAVVNRLLWMQDIMRLDSGDRVLQKTAIGFDVAVWEWFLPLMTGAALVIARSGGQKDPTYLQTVIEKNQVTVLHFVPSMLAVFLESLPSNACRSIKQIVTSGEALSGTVQAQTFAHLPDTQLWNLYGPTEAAIDVSVWPCSAQDGIDTPPIGMPIWNTALYILDSTLEPLPHGIAGELYIAGINLARGYLGRSGLTAERFIACPFGEPGSRMYRSGDLARRRADGAIEYLGRIDDQVKIRGYRIELGEIEAALLRHDPNLAQVAVITRQIQSDQRLVAYLVAHKGCSTLGIEELGTALMSTLPDYMVPTYFMEIDALPLSINGKLDRRALPNPIITADTQNYRAPRTDTEHMLCRLFAEVTGVPQVGIDDRFFTLGGDSISAIRLVSRIKAEGYAVSVRDIFKNQTPASLIGALQDVSTRSLTTWPTEGDLPALPIYLEYLSVNSSINQFNQTIVLQAPASLDHATVTQALNNLVKHHSALRMRAEGKGLKTRFIIDAIQKTPAPTVQVLSLLQKSADQANQSIRAEIEALAATLNPREPGGMIKALWVVRDELPPLLILTLHHFIVDGVSWRILFDDLKTLCTNVLARLPEPTMSLLAWATDLEHSGRTGQHRVEEALWHAQYTKTTLLSLDTAIEETANTQKHVKTISGHLTVAQTEEVIQAQSTYQSDINEFLLAALGLAFRQWSTSQYNTPGGDLVIALEGHGRDSEVDLTQTVGWFTSMFPVKLEVGDLNPDNLDSAGHALRRIKDRLRAMPSKGLGFGILRHLDQNSQLAQLPPDTPQVIFNYLGRLDKQNTDIDEWQLIDDYATTTADDPERRRLHLIEINAIISPTGMFNFDIHFCQLAWRPESIQALARCFEAALLQVIEHCLKKPFRNRFTPSDFPLVFKKSEVTQVIDQSILDQLVETVKDLKDIVPLTPAQQGLVFESLKENRSLVDPYQIQVALVLEGTFDTHAMFKAWARLVQRHDILRLSLTTLNGSLGFGIIHDEQFIDAKFIELDGNDQQRIAQLQQADLQDHFNLEQGPLIRLRLGHLSGQKHVMLISQHHLILDGWSLQVLMRELAQIYDADIKQFSDGLAQTIPWQEHLHWLSTQDSAAARQYWKLHLSELTEPSRLQFAQAAPGPSVTEEIQCVIDAALYEQMNSFGRAHGITQATILLGLYALTLGKVSRLKNIVVGNVNNGRSRSANGIEQAIGLFINTLPLFIDLPSDKSLQQWLTNLQLTQSEQDQYSHIGLAEIQNLAGFSGTSVFDALFVFENFPSNSATIALGDLTVLDSIGHDGTNYPLALGVFPGDPLRLRLTYDRSRFDRSTVQQIMDRLLFLARSLHTIGETPLGTIRLTNDDERTAIIKASTHPITLEPNPAVDIIEIFETTTAAQVNKCALRFREQREIASISYFELNARANQIARYLISLGLGSGEIVALLLPRSHELITSILAVLKTGATYLPLDPDYPASRIEFILKDSKVQRVVSTESIYDQLSLSLDTKLPALLDFEDPIVNLLISTQAQSNLTNTDRLAKLLPEALAYVIYTSGSTGLPKGVGISHASAANLVLAQREIFKLKHSDCVLQFASPAFDASVWEMLLAFGSGAALAIPDSARTDAASTLLNDLQAFEVTHATLPPALVAVLEAHEMGALKTLVVAGEACSPEIVRRFAPDRKMFNAYGPTENTVCATISRALDPVADGATGSTPVSIGYPLVNMQVYLLDDSLEPVAPGMLGELYISGLGLARGYIGRAALTAERFIACPFGPAGQRMYRSGDVARRRPDGAIEFWGRADDQVKIHGYRIELGEIESLLLTLSDALRQVSVIARDFDGDLRLVAYFVTKDGVTDLDIESLKQGLSAQLPEYMVPRYFMALAELPFTPNGKLDKRGLPDPISTQSESQYTAARTSNEQVLCEIFCQLTSYESVGVKDSFFSLGGDSISVIRLVTLARAKGLIFSVQDVFAHQTPENIAAQARLAEDTLQRKQAPEEGPLPALPVFHQFWQLAGSFKQFNQAVLLSAPNHITLTSVRSSLEKLRECHGALRLRCTENGDKKQLIIDPVSAMPTLQVYELDLTGLDAALARDKLTARFLSLSEHLDPSKIGCVLVGLWITTPEGLHQLALVIHHYAVDGVSWRIIIDDLNNLSYSTSQPLEVASTSLRTWSEFLAVEATQGNRHTEVDFWREQIEDLPKLPVESGFSDEMNTLGNAAHFISAVDQNETKNLVAAAAVYGGGINDLFLVALGFALEKWARTNYRAQLSDPVIDIEGHGREMEVDLTRTVGWLTTVFPLKVKTKGLLSNENNHLGLAIQRVKESLRAVPDKGLGFGVLRYLDPTSPLADVQQHAAQIGFNYLGRFEKSKSTSDQWHMAEDRLIAAKDSDDRARLHLIDINTAINQSGALDIAISYCQTAHRESDIADLANFFKQLLVTVSQHCLNSPLTYRRTLSDFPLLHQSLPPLNDVTQETLSALETDYPNFEDIVPLTHLQQGLAFETISRATGTRDPYHVHLLLTLSGRFDGVIMQHAWQRVVKRHQSLRLVVAPVNCPTGYGIVLNETSANYQVVQLTGEKQERLAQLKALDFATPFNLEKGPLIRFYEADLGDNNWAILISNHHMILDGWSLPILTGELAHLYQSEYSRIANNLNDSFKWSSHLRWLQQQDHEGARAYWKHYLGELTEPSRLDLSPPPNPSYGMKNLERVLSETATTAIDSYAKEYSLTQATVLQGLYALVLARQSKLNEIVIGSVRNGRTSSLSRINEGVGLFINTLPLYTTLEPAQTLTQWLQKQQVEMAEQDSFGFIGLREIQKLTGLAGSALFEAMFVFENYPISKVEDEVGEIQLTDAQSDDGNHYPIGLSVLLGDRMTLRLSFDQSRMKEHTAQQILEQLTSLIARLAKIQAMALSEIPLLSQNERNALVQTSIGKVCDDNVRLKSILPLIDAHILSTPKSIALSYEVHSQKQVMTYEELDRSANQFARYVIEQGLGPDDIIGVLLTRTPELLITLLGILRAGAAYLPLDSDYPIERLTFMLEDSGSKLVFSRGGLATDLQQRFTQAQLKIVDLDSSLLTNKIAALSDQQLSPFEPVASLLPDNLAYLIYTSGSTGQPKGVALSHHGMLNYITWAMDAYNVSSGSGAPINTSIAFDATITSLWLPLVAGKTIHFVAQEGEIEALAKELQEQRNFSLVKLTPAHLEALRHLLPKDTLDNQTKSYVIGGEQLTAATVSFWRDFSPNTRLINEYGPTETVVGCCVYEVNPTTSFNGVIPIGKPIWNTQLYLLDPSLEPVSPDTVGELYIAGDGLARGYLGRTGLTAERFIACPFGSPGSRMYRTGDLARRQEDGVFIYLGRVDDQVKIRGYRIELGEIETALLKYIGNLAHAVVVTKKIGVDFRLVAYLVPNDGVACPEPTQISQVLSQYLPEHMIPGLFVTLAELPLTPNGKLDRQRLPTPGFTTDTQTYEAPRTKNESIFCEIFALLTGISAVSVNDSFFSLGGDSILSIRLVSSSRAAGLSITVKEIFELQTPSKLALRARIASDVAVSTEWPEEGKFSGLPIYHEFLKTNGALKKFNQTVCLQAPEHITYENVQRGLNALIDQHAALRLRLHREESGSTFTIDPIARTHKPKIEILDLRDLTEDSSKQKIASIIHHLSDELSPEDGQLIVARWVLRQGLPALLILTIHHFAVDGVSWRILVEDLDTLTNQGSTKLLPKTMSLLSWSRQLSEQADQGLRRLEEPFWLRQLATIRPLPQDNVTTKAQNTLANVDIVTGQIDKLSTKNLIKASTVYYGGMNDVLLTALGLALCRWCEASFGYRLGDPVVMLEGHGREGDVDLSRSVGWFTTAFPIRLPLEQFSFNMLPESSNRAVRTIKECLRSLPDRGLGYGILRHLDPTSQLNHADTAQPQILFNYLGRFEPTSQSRNKWMLTADSLTAASDDTDRIRLQLLDINAIIDDTNSFKFNIAYCKKAYTEKSINGLVKLFEETLATIARDCVEAPLEIRYTPHDFSLMISRTLDQPNLIKQEQLDVLLHRFSDIEDLVPLTSLQQGLAYESLSVGSHSDDPYHVQLVLTLQGEIDLAAMQRAWDHLISRHSILRLVLAPAGVAPGVGLIRSNIDFRIKTYSLSGSSDARRDALRRTDLAEHFDFETGPLIRLSICRLDDNSNALLISNHHLILDGWSSAQLGSEFAQLYESERSDKKIALAEPFLWQEHLKWLTLQDKDLAKSYWKTYLTELTEPTHIQFPKPLNPQVGMSEVTIELDQELSNCFRQFARDHMITQATALQALFALLLGQFFGLNEIVIGTVRHGRSSLLPGIDRAIGLFINTLPVYVKLSPQQNFKHWLQDQQNDAIAQEAYEYLTLGEIQALTRIVSASMFEALFVFENYPSNGATQSAGDLTVTKTQSADGTHYPIALSVVPSQSILLRLGFDTAKVDQKFAKEFLSHFKNLISALPDLTNAPLASLLSFCDSEQTKTIQHSTGKAVFNDTTTLTIADLFNRQVVENPERPALSSMLNGCLSTLTYAELDAESNQYARYLIERGIGPDSIVAIMLERTPEMIIAILGALKAGAAYLPMDLSQPTARLQFMLSDSQAQLLISNESTLNDVFKEDLPRDVAILDISAAEYSSAIARQTTRQITSDERHTTLSPDHLAYVIYTSGSTGMPKGVCFLQKSLTNLVAWQQATYPELPQTVLQYSSIGFDVSAQEIIATLTRGARLVLIDEENRKDSFSMLEYIENHNIDLLHVPYVVLNNLALSRSQHALPNWPKVLITAGEQLQVTPEIRQIYERYPDYALHNHYGPTETHVVTSYVLDDDAMHWDEFPPIGKPIWNTQLFILNSRLAPAPEGTVGELYIAGDCLARGYLSKFSLTAERFIANPFGKPGARMYRSGDLVRRRVDGQIEYIGRADEQVKIRGYRIELGEVEAALLKYIPELAQVAVLVRDLAGEKRLIAYTVVTPDHDLRNPTTLRSLLGAHLPDYMVPSYFVKIDALPITGNGKLDRRLLPDPDLSDLQTQYVAPRSMRETYLCQLFAELMNIESVGIDDSFYDLGGHSLLAMQLVSRVRLDLEINLSLRTLFSHPTPRLLASALNDSKHMSYEPLLPLKKSGERQPIFCIHPGGGSGSVYKNLADALPTDVPVWALQARGLEDTEAPHRSVTEMATTYIEAIKTIQPEGPYQLVGWSFGGTIAQEMAVQIEAIGQCVSLLALLDTTANPQALPEIEFDEATQIQKILENFATSMQIQDEIVDIDNDHFVRRLILDMSAQGLVPETTPPDIFRKTAAYMIRATQLTSAHATRKCAANIVFVRAAREPAPDDPRVFNWAQHCKGTVVETSVDSSHAAIWEQSSSHDIAAILLPYLSSENK